jgi:general secretion pathway protein J
MKYSHGFTLLEMIVAISIFAIISAITFSSLDNFLDGHEVLQERLDELKQLQSAMTIIERDMRFLINRPVRNGYGDTVDALMVDLDQEESNNILEVTVALPNMLIGGMSELQRVAYRIEGEYFYRINWSVLDKDLDSKEVKRLLVSNLTSVEVSLLVSEGSSLRVVTDMKDDEKKPDGIEWRFVLKDGNTYNRLFEVPSEL